MKDFPHDIDEQASRGPREEPADFPCYDEGGSPGPSTMDRTGPSGVSAGGPVNPPQPAPVPLRLWWDVANDLEGDYSIVVEKDEITYLEVNKHMDKEAVKALATLLFEWTEARGD